MTNMTNRISAAILRNLYFPPARSHKGDNGRLLVVAGSRQYHGSLLFAVKAAAKIVDLLYILSTPDNQQLISKLKFRTAAFIPVKNLENTLTEVDAALVGPGIDISEKNKKILQRILQTRKKVVLDAAAIRMLDDHTKAMLHTNAILTPHKGEFRAAFNLPVTEKNARVVASKNKCTVILKGRVDIVASPDGEIKKNYTGNQGMTKGGTGDILAGLIAAFLCKNGSQIAAAAGIYLNGKAGDDLYKKAGPYYDSEDLIEQIPRTLWQIIKS